MVAINVVNVVPSVLVYRKNRLLKDTRDVKYQRWMLAMGFIFTLVGFYRSIFVTSYGRRYGWFDTILNSTGVVRTMAMFAELSFFCQCL